MHRSAENRGETLITIKDRPALESLVCECYEVMLKDYESLFGVSPAGD